MRIGQISKYKARKTAYKGAIYDSAKEAERAAELELLQRAGKIRNLRRQVKFTLQEGFLYEGRKIRAIEYVADFVYEADGLIIEDVKGYRTPEYKIKAKMLKKLIASGEIDGEFKES